MDIGTRLGRALLLTTFAMLLASPTAWPQAAIQDVPPTRAQRIENLDQAIRKVQEVFDSTRKMDDKSSRDLRGLTLLQYLEQWAYTPAMMKELSELLAKSRAAPEADNTALDRADELITVA